LVIGRRSSWIGCSRHSDIAAVIDPTVSQFKHGFAQKLFQPPHATGGIHCDTNGGIHAQAPP
jgi:hypothetical protein